MNLESLDWEVLDRLRETFLSDRKSAGSYWHTITDLEAYNLTYGERIGWKWDAVLAELKQHGWSPCGKPGRTAPAGATVSVEPGRTTCGEPSRTILDWGCGSGVAGRRVVTFFGPTTFDRLLVHDRSELAMDFSVHHGRKQFPQFEVDRADVRFLRGTKPIGVLVVSHVLNELDDTARADLTDLCDRAQTILWVEPGTHEVSRALGGWREKLRAGGFHAVAPCPHQAACGILVPGNERHWCHFFASPPAGLYADSAWVKFGQRAGIDLRSLPYSFLVLDRNVGASLADARAGAVKQHPYEDRGLSRIIGSPRLYKGYAKVFNCDAGGVTELMLQKRDAPELFKALKQGEAAPMQHWTHANGRIIPDPTEPTTT